MEGPTYGDIEVEVSDTSGKPIEDVQLELYSIAGKQLYSTSAKDLKQVPYGQYKLRVHAKGFGSTWKDLQLDQTTLHLRIEMQVGWIGCPPTPAAIQGKVNFGEMNAATPQDPLWVKAIPVRGIGASETKVGAYGFFLLTGLEHTEHLLLVMRGSRLLHQELVHAQNRGRSPITITLENSSVKPPAR